MYELVYIMGVGIFFSLFKVHMLYKQIIISSLGGNLNALNPQLI